ncbi:MAG: hypothetical protein HND52_16585 [Ignavibacteriae bacterium]|nr:hypothetical protein [Ignavibacteriota bacterium]NOG99576.1 hypothetical protein [Ignavibacteriota bacterium]
MDERNILFNNKSFFDVRRNYQSQLNEEIKSFKRDYLLSVNTNDVIDYLVKKYCFEPISLLEDKIEVVKQGEKDVVDRSWGEPITIRANYYIFAVPFTGHSELFLYQPSTFNYNPPRAEIRNSELILSIQQNENNPEEIKTNLSSQLGSIKTYLAWINADALQYNSQIKASITQSVSSRKAKLLEDQKTLSSLGFPLRERKDSMPTYISDVKRKINIQPPVANNKPYQPEPELELKEYEAILKTLKNMIVVMERSPKAFANMDEETLRTHFLVQLNAMYEGSATGETFNYEGKTDILIRVNGKNIFIAECKFWKGPKTITETITQLLGYLSWRDTKTSILIFNRNKDTTNVISQIPDLIKGHSNYKKDFQKISETDFRFILKSKDDAERELINTLMVFDIPK